MNWLLLLQFLNRTLLFCQEADVADAMSAMILVEKFVNQLLLTCLSIRISDRILEGAQEHPDMITFALQKHIFCFCERISR